MKKIFLLIIIFFLFGCVSSIKTNHHKLHRSSGKKPFWATEEIASPIVEIDGERYFLVKTEGKNLEYLQRVVLDLEATKETLNFYGAEQIKFHGMVRERSYWEQYEIKENGLYGYSYKVWGLYSIPKTISP